MIEVKKRSNDKRMEKYDLDHIFPVQVQAF